MHELDWVSSYEEYANRLMGIYQVPGVSMGIAKDGNVEYTGSFGFRDLERQIPVTADTVFGIGSVTKSFTCVAIMILQEEGKLSVHDPVVKYLPAFQTSKPEWSDCITIHHFMTHTSGLPPLPALGYAIRKSQEGDPIMDEIPAAEREKLRENPEIETFDALLDHIRTVEIPLLGEPGTHFSYSNDGYALLGAIVEAVSGTKYETFITERILKPAGMHHSCFAFEDLNEYEDVTVLYATRKRDGKDEVFKSPIWQEAPSMNAAGFLRSTVSDMLRYTEIFRTGGQVHGSRILSPESVALMKTPYVDCGPNLYYGYGLMITPDYQGMELIDHGGALKGVSAQIYVLPEQQLTGVAFANLAGVPSAQILLGALNAYLGIELDTRRVAFNDYECDADQLPYYEGQFSAGEGQHIRITLEDGSLFMRVNEEKLPMRLVGEHQFAVKLKEIEAPLRYLVDEDGQIYGVFFGVREIRKVRQPEEVA